MQIYIRILNRAAEPDFYSPHLFQFTSQDLSEASPSAQSFYAYCVKLVAPSSLKGNVYSSSMLKSWLSGSGQLTSLDLGPRLWVMLDMHHRLEMLWLLRRLGLQRTPPRMVMLCSHPPGFYRHSISVLLPVIGANGHLPFIELTSP